MTQQYPNGEKIIAPGTVIGNVGPQLVSDMEGGIAAASHSDGIALNCSLWIDGVQVLDEGKVVGPTEEFVELARQLGH